jgi:hypothetical protein
MAYGSRPARGRPLDVREITAARLSAFRVVLDCTEGPQPSKVAATHTHGDIARPHVSGVSGCLGNAYAVSLPDGPK